jgi:hypothetical protein
MPRIGLDSNLLSRVFSYAVNLSQEPGFSAARNDALVAGFRAMQGRDGSLKAGLFASAQSFLQSDIGKRIGSKTESLTPHLGGIADELVKRLPAGTWDKVTAAAAQKGTISGLVTKNVLPTLETILGNADNAKGAATKLGRFAEGILGTATTSGFGKALEFGAEEAPKLAGFLDKIGLFGKLAKGVGKFLPGIGLVTSLVGAVKTLSDPNKTGLQKFAAVLDVAGGAAGLIPGLGTGVQAAISGVTTAVSAGADLLSTPAKGQQGWVNAGSPSSTRPVSLLDDGFDGKLP